jgi:hypothetical protein
VRLQTVKKDLIAVSQDMLEQALDNEVNISGKPRVPRSIDDRTRALEERKRVEAAYLRKLKSHPAYFSSFTHQVAAYGGEESSYADPTEEMEDESRAPLQPMTNKKGLPKLKQKSTFKGAVTCFCRHPHSW